MSRFVARTCFSLLTVLLFVARASASDNGEPSSLSPRITSQPGNYTVLEGEEVILECTVEGLEESDIVLWQANQSGVASTIALNGAVAGNKRHRYSVVKDGSRRQHHLIISDAALEDEGTFMCEVFGSNPVSQQHRLTVNVPPSVTVSPPGFLAVTLGEPIELTCNAEGKPKPEVTWSKTGGDFSHQGNTLRIDESTVDDAGEYFCVADNGVGMSPATAFIEVLVQYAPTVEVEESVLYTEVGHTARVSIVCHFDAVPPVEVVWRHNQSRINFRERGRLTERHAYDGIYIMDITSLLPEDLGEYECVGGNSQGQAIGTVTIRAEPHDLEIESELEGLYSDQYRLEWAVISHNPLVEFDLRIQEVNETHNSSWLSSTIPAPRHHVLHHKQNYVISELKPSTQYRIKLRARNTYGYSDWTEFEFNTNEAGYTAPPHSPTSTDITLTEPRQQQSLYGDDNDLEAYTVVISPYHAGVGNAATSISVTITTFVAVTSTIHLL